MILCWTPRVAVRYSRSGRTRPCRPRPKVDLLGRQGSRRAGHGGIHRKGSIVPVIMYVHAATVGARESSRDRIVVAGTWATPTAVEANLGPRGPGVASSMISSYLARGCVWQCKRWR